MSALTELEQKAAALAMKIETDIEAIWARLLSR